MTQPTSAYGEQTRAVHTPLPAPVPQRPLGLPVHRTSAFAFDTGQEYADVLGGVRPGYSYSRVDNPTADAFATAVAALEGVGVEGEVVGQAFASGMAAIATTIMSVTSAGAHVVAPAAVYGGTWSLLEHVLSRFGVATTFVDGRDLDAVRAALRPETRLIWAETIANPTTAVADLPGLAAVAHEAGALLGVDSTFASPAVCRPLEWGADLVVHSATKYVGGHSDATGGVVLGRPEVIEPVRALRLELGGMLAPDEAFLLHRGLATLPLRVTRANATARLVAEALAEQGVAVHYPGLPGHRDHALAGKLFDSGRYGAIVTLTPPGGRAGGLAFCDALRLVTVATSLGGTHSVVSHVASTTHRQLDDAALAAAGIDAGAVRVSVGLEDPDDLITDLTAALGAAGDDPRD